MPGICQRHSNGIFSDTRCFLGAFKGGRRSEVSWPLAHNGTVRARQRQTPHLGRHLHTTLSIAYNVGFSLEFTTEPFFSLADFLRGDPKVGTMFFIGHFLVGGPVLCSVISLAARVSS